MLEAGRSYLLVGKLSPTAINEVLPVDRLETSAIGLDIATLRHFLSLTEQKPYGSLRLLYIKNADKLSHLLQTTLLKTLEEPPSLAAIVLEVTSAESLLPTVKSRLLPLEIGSVTMNTDNKSELDFSAEAEVRQKLLGQTIDRSRAVEILSGGLGKQRQLLISQPSPVTAERIELLERAIFCLNHNVNQKLALEIFCLDWFGSSKGK